MENQYTEKLLNQETGVVEDIPLDDLASAIASGKYLGKPGQRFKMRNRVGRVGEVDVENIFNALGDGYQFIDAASLEKADKEAKYGTLEQQAKGYAEAALRGTTVGLSDVALTKSGLVDPADAEGRREAVGVGGSITEGAAMLLPMFIPGGAGVTAAKAGLGRTVLGATKAASLPRHLSTAARLVEKELTSIGVKGAAKAGLVQHVMAKAAVGAGEFSVYGLGHELSRAALEDREVTAESILSNVGPTALIGAGLMGGGALAWGGGKALVGKAYGKFADTAEKLTMQADELMKKGTPEAEAQASKIYQYRDSMYEKVGGAWKERAEKLGKEAGESGYSVSGDTSPATTTEQLVNFLNEGNQGVTFARRVNERRKEIPGWDQKTAEKTIPKLSDDLATEITTIGDDVVSRYNQQAAEILNSEAVKKSGVTSKGTIVKDALDRRKDAMLKAARAEPGKDVPKNIRVMQQNIEKLLFFPKIGKRARKARDLAPADLKKVVEVIDDEIDRAGKFLRKELFGLRKEVREQLTEIVKKAVPNQADDFERIMAKQHRSLELKRGFEKRYVEVSPATGKKNLKFGKSEEILGKMKNDLDGTQEAKTLMEMITELGRLRKDLGLDSFVESFKDRIAWEGTVGRPSVPISELAEQAFTAVAGKVSGHGLKSSSAILSMYRWLRKRIASGVSEKLLSDQSNVVKNSIEKLGEIFNMVKNDKGKVLAAADTFTGKAKDKLKFSLKAPRITAPIFTKALMEFNLGGNNNPKDDREAVRNIRADIDSIIADPEKLARAIAPSDTINRIDPELGMQVSAKKAAIINVLAENLPKGQDKYEEINGRAWQPSDAEVAESKRLVAVIQSPDIIFGAMNAGTLTPKMVKVFKEAYPRKYEDLKLAIMENLAVTGNLPYAKRGILMFMFGVPADLSYERETVKQIQGNYFNEPTEGDIAGGRKTGGQIRMKGADKLSYSGDAATEMQRIEGR